MSNKYKIFQFNKANPTELCLIFRENIEKNGPRVKVIVDKAMESLVTLYKRRNLIIIKKKIIIIKELQ